MGPICHRQDLTLEKSYIFHTTLDEDNFYMKIIALDEIYNFLVLSFSIWIVKMLKKYYKISAAY
jgi:hypothetical protein